MLALAAVAITFLDVSAWKHVPVREVWIPAFRATVVNASGIDWAEARLRVRSHCADGEAAYEVKARNLLVGEQRVEAVIYDGITRQIGLRWSLRKWSFLEGRQFRRISGLPSCSSASGWRMPRATSARTWRGSSTTAGAAIPISKPSGSTGATAARRSGSIRLRTMILYCFRVRPGEMGIAGFLLNRDAQSEGPLTRFLRFFEIPPGKEAWLGVFEITQGPGQMVSVTIDGKPEMVERLQALRQRAVVAAAARRPRTFSVLTMSK